MKSEFRALLFCMVLFVVVPALYALGEWWGGVRLAIGLPAAAVVASFAYMKLGDREPPGGPPAGLPRLHPPPGGTSAS